MNFVEAFFYILCGAMSMVCFYIYVKMKDDWK
jgi:hypothetical protein